MKQDVAPPADLEFLTALGFGPEAVLMNEPRLFVDRRFLAHLMIELQTELGNETAKTVIFQIGLMHGLRDSFRVMRDDFSRLGPTTSPTVPEALPLAIQLGAPVVEDPDHAIQMPGHWPERYEAEARLAKLGPTDEPTCHLSAGYTSGWLSGILDADMLVSERCCAACGDSTCEFDAREVESWRDSDDPWMLSLVGSICFDTLRGFASQRADATRSRALQTHEIDADSNDIHVWGPVMILPYVDSDSAVQAISMLGREAETTSVRVVVLDLRDRPLSESFDAAAIELILDAIEGWGAEVILTGVSPLSEAAVADLECNHLLLRKSLPEAIATAFQVAEAQRHLL